MRLKIASKISIFFSLILLFIFLLTYLVSDKFQDDVIHNSVMTNLDTTAELIKKIVRRNVTANEGLVRKNLFIAEQFIENNVSTSREQIYSYDAVHPLTEKVIPIAFPSLYLDKTLVSKSHTLVDSIRNASNCIVTIYQYSPGHGFVSVSTTLTNSDGSRRIGTYLPKKSPVDKMLMKNSILVQREYYDKQWYFSAYKLLYEGENIAGAIYVAVKQVNMEALRDDLLTIKIGKTGFPYIIGNVGKLIVHPDSEGEDIYYKPHIKEIVFQKNGKIEYVETKNGIDRKRIDAFKYIPEMHWIVIAGTFLDEYYDRINILKRLQLFIFSIAIFFAFVGSIFITRKISMPINVIIEKIKEMSESEADFNKQLSINSKDEIRELAFYFNNFVSKLRNFKEMEKKEIEFFLRDIQIIALQNQINPHFLYNTLDTIIYLIELGDDRSVEMVQLLSDLFRVSIGKGEKIVTLREEIEHVKLYASIQKIRFPDLFEVKYNIEDECLNLYILKFILQPIVENSIMHGFSYMERNGVINIDCTKASDKYLHISVTDNGSGFRGDPFDSSYSTGIQKSHGVGLINIRERIRLHFGNEYSMAISSQKGLGTTVTLKLPILTSSSEKNLFSHKIDALR